MRAQQISKPLSHYGTSPAWWPRQHQLRFVDSHTGEVLSVGTEPRPSIPTTFARWLAPRAGGGAIVVGDEQWALSNFDDLGDVAEIGALSDHSGHSFLGGGIDPDGGLWLGLTSESGSQLAHLDVGSRRPRPIATMKVCGVAFSPDAQTMYAIAPNSGVVWALSYDPIDGLGPSRKISNGPGIASGLCVDHEGGVWTTRYGSGQLLRHDSDGQLTATLELDNAFPTDCCFGDQDLSTLFITTAGTSGHNERGAVYAARPGVSGLSTFGFAG